MTSTSKLQDLLTEAITSDLHEEPAIEFLEDNGIPFHSHNRQFLIELAWRNGWRPTP